MAICVLAILAGVLLAGCTTCPRGKRWGKPCTSWHRIGQAAKNAVLDPYTWGPLIPAAVLAANETWDREIADWARRETPIFGSTKNASNAGRAARNYCMACGLATAIATPSGPHPYWGTNKAIGIAVQTGAALAPQAVVLEMKEATDRVRPNKKDDLSFPSTISSEAAAWAASARRNIREIPVSRGWRTAMEIAVEAGAATTAWSRVENGSHFPTDCLVGLSIGNALSLFIQDSLLGPSWREMPSIGVGPARGGVNLNVGYSGKL